MEVDELKAELESERTKVGELTAKLEDVRLEGELSRKLAEAGAIDIDGALAIAKEKITDGSIDANACVEELKKQKRYLFAVSADKVTLPVKTAGAREKINSGETALQKAAQKAARSGSRVDLHEYLRLRRTR
ncbi:MAG: hypothetical protein PHF37_04045 [Phycisphaerae bacterium]|nr:hypothetical protein [Phycisphaerae bacterium]